MDDIKSETVTLENELKRELETQGADFVKFVDQYCSVCVRL